MLNNLKNSQQVYLVTGYIDLRRSIDGLAAIVQAQLKLVSEEIYCTAYINYTLECTDMKLKNKHRKE